MGVNLDDYRELLEDLGPHAAELLRASWQEAARAFSPRGLESYLQGARALHALGRGPEPVAAFVREAPAVAREAGEDAVSELLRAALALASKTSGGVIAAVFGAAPTAARRLADPELFRGWLGLVGQLVAQAPRGVRPMLENLDRLLAVLTLGGLRRWALWGARAHATDFAAQERYFALAEPAGFAGIFLWITSGRGVARICQLVEGIPLAIELAASWTRSLGTHQIAQEIQRNIDFLATRMRDIPERHRSMQAVFDQSWSLLNREAQSVFKRLSVFKGGFQLDAARSVSAGSLAVLSALVDKSLLRVDPEERYQVHELLRQYAEEQVSHSREELERIRDLHCSYYIDYLQPVPGAGRKMSVGLRNFLQGYPKIGSSPFLQGLIIRRPF